MTEEITYPEVHSKQSNAIADGTRPSTASIVSFTQRVSVASIGQLLTIVAVSGYVLGLLVVNMYLFKIGVSDFSILRPRFVLTGFLATLPLLLLINIIVAIVIAVLGFVEFLRSNGSRKDKRVSVLFWLSTVSTACIIVIVAAGIWRWVTVSGIDFRSDLIAAIDWRSIDSLLWILFLTPIVVTTYVLTNREASTRNHHQRAWLHAIGYLYGLLLVLGFVGFWYIDFFTSTFYPIVPEQFGGGRSKEVLIVLSSESNALGTTLGFGETKQELISRNVDLLWETEQMYVVRDRSIPDSTAIQIDRDAVSAIVFAFDTTPSASPIATQPPDE